MRIIHYIVLYSAQSLIYKVLGLQNVPFRSTADWSMVIGLHDFVCKLYPTLFFCTFLKYYCAFLSFY